jgi:hypothetical protein
MRTLILVAAATLFVSGIVRAQEHPDMTAAQHDLESAKSHLQAAGHDYGGHRKAALEAVDRALRDVREGLASVEKKENKVEKKENKAQKHADALKAKDQKMQAK